MTPGRPRTLTDIHRAEVAALISAGMNLVDAARQVGCSVRTLRTELKHNPDFRREVDDARVKARLEPLRLMRQAANTHWRAAAWLLERSDAQRSKSRRTDQFSSEDVTVAMDELIEVALLALSDQRSQGDAFTRLNIAKNRLLQQLATPGKPFRRLRPTPLSDIAHFLHIDRPEDPLPPSNCSTHAATPSAGGR